MLVCARVQQREMLQRVRRIGVEAAETAVAAEAAAEAAEAAEASETAEAAAEASETAEAGERGQVGLPRSWRVCMCEGRSATRNPRNPRPAGPRILICDTFRLKRMCTFSQKIAYCRLSTVRQV
jgi:hypothetical protein